MSARTITPIHLPRGLFYDEHWGARCATCGTWLSKYDWTREEALANAADAPCKCSDAKDEAT